MQDQEGSNEADGDCDNACSSSPPPKSSKNGSPDDYGDSKPQHALHDFERESSKSRKDGEKVKEREKERDRDNDCERERDRDNNCHHRSQSDRSKGDDNDEDVDDYPHRERERWRDCDKDRDGRHWHRPRSCSRGRYDCRSRSRSPSRSKRIHTTGFDMAPASAVLTDGDGTAAAAASTAGQLNEIAPSVPGVFPNITSVQVPRHALRVYVGGLPPTVNEQSLATFFSHAMSAIGGNTAGPGNAVVDVYINHEKKFAFVEMRSVEEASNAMALDGIIFEETPVKVRRPSDYNHSLAAALGPCQPNPNLNLAAVGLTPGAAGGVEGPDRIFVGGLPYYFTEAQIRELLESFGTLRVLDLVKDRETGNSKGFAFCVYQDISVTDIACAALNRIKIGDRTLTVRRANQGSSHAKLENESTFAQAHQQRVSFQGGSGALATKVVCLTHVVSADELRDDEEYEDILEDIKGEGGKFGRLMNVVIPRPSPIGEPSPGVGKVFLQYADSDGAEKAYAGLNGRIFGGMQVVAVLYPENKFTQKEYNG